MPLYRTATHYYEADDVQRVDSSRVRVSGMYAPLDDRDALKRRFCVYVRVRVTGEQIEAAIQDEAARDREAREAYA